MMLNDAMHQHLRTIYIIDYNPPSVSREGLAPIVKAYSRLIPVDGLVL